MEIVELVLGWVGWILYGLFLALSFFFLLIPVSIIVGSIMMFVVWLTEGRFIDRLREMFFVSVAGFIYIIGSLLAVFFIVCLMSHCTPHGRYNQDVYWDG